MASISITPLKPLLLPLRVTSLPLWLFSCPLPETALVKVPLASLKVRSPLAIILPVPSARTSSSRASAPTLTVVEALRLAFAWVTVKVPPATVKSPLPVKVPDAIPPLVRVKSPPFRFSVEPVLPSNSPIVWVLPLISAVVALAKLSLALAPKPLSVPSLTVPDFRSVTPV